MTPSNPTKPEHWQRGNAYERYMGRWSRLLGPRFLHFIDMPHGSRWLDVGCGTGELSAVLCELCAPASLTGADPSAGFLATAKERLPSSVVLHQAPADRLPLADDAVDASASSLVLNFVPDALAALREMARVTVPGGRVAACVWDYAGTMELTRFYWDAADELGLLEPGEHQGERFPICQPEALLGAFNLAGLKQVQVAGIDIEMRFHDFDDYWQPFLGGQGTAPAHAMSLDAASRDRLREKLSQRITRQDDGGFALAARAWAARGDVPV